MIDIVTLLQAPTWRNKNTQSRHLGQISDRNIRDGLIDPVHEKIPRKTKLLVGFPQSSSTKRKKAFSFQQRIRFRDVTTNPKRPVKLIQSGSPKGRTGGSRKGNTFANIV